MPYTWKYFQRAVVVHVETQLAADVMLQAFCSQVSWWASAWISCHLILYVLQMVPLWATNLGLSSICGPAINKSQRFLPFSRFSRKGQKWYCVGVNK